MKKIVQVRKQDADENRRGPAARCPACEDFEIKLMGKEINPETKKTESSWRIRVVMSRLPGEPLDNWIERARNAKRTSPRSG